MSEPSNKSQIKLSRKNSKKFTEVLRRLAKSDSSLIKKMKITVCEDDTNVNKKNFLIAPSMFMNCHRIYHASTENTNVNIIKNLITEKENSNPIDTELINYPDSSDFYEDDE